jgi:hypothetical protein
VAVFDAHCHGGPFLLLPNPLKNRFRWIITPYEAGSRSGSTRLEQSFTSCSGNGHPIWGRRNWKGTKSSAAPKMEH